MIHISLLLLFCFLYEIHTYVDVSVIYAFVTSDSLFFLSFACILGTPVQPRIIGHVPPPNPLPPMSMQVRSPVSYFKGDE